MADEAASQNINEDLDIESIKVADLRKGLKDESLPVTGNKSELVEHLQDNAALNPGEFESSSSELDSSLLNDSSKLNSSSGEPEDKDDVKTGVDELPVSSTEKLKAPVTKSEKPKRIILNRTHIPTPKFIPNKPAEPLKIKNIVTIDNIDISEKKDHKEGIAIVDTIKDGPNKICLSAIKNMSDNERISLRAKKFNIAAPEPITKSGKITITSKKNETASATSTASSDSTPSTTEKLDFTAKQRRAFRFGINIPQAVKQLEKQENTMKRKAESKIGNGVSNAEEQEKKKKRAERFGISN